ncbi:hypothetical protein CJF31_00003162 [Rutstroemia sp. NJR-2017a BVV2]|nr:hypothetical protein CJF31_00001954 [Rutstroemia sp. NJR-2017a BVV2]PQE18501.1 hypothetical protein CJF31_00003162 [Rutstroemia sp. NJR-2017a BVV2]
MHTKPAGTPPDTRLIDLTVMLSTHSARTGDQRARHTDRRQGEKAHDRNANTEQKARAHRRGFFIKGRVFATSWSDNGEDESDQTFVVIREAGDGDEDTNTHCICLSVAPVEDDINLREYGFLYGGTASPKPIEGILRQPLRLEPAKGTTFNEPLLVNYLRLFSVDTNSEVIDVGLLADESMQYFIENFKATMFDPEIMEKEKENEPKKNRKHSRMPGTGKGGDEDSSHLTQRHRDHGKSHSKPVESSSKRPLDDASNRRKPKLSQLEIPMISKKLKSKGNAGHDSDGREDESPTRDQGTQSMRPNESKGPSRRDTSPTRDPFRVRKGHDREPQSKAKLDEKTRRGRDHDSEVTSRETSPTRIGRDSSRQTDVRSRSPSPRGRQVSDLPYLRKPGDQDYGRRDPMTFSGGNNPVDGERRGHRRGGSGHDIRKGAPPSSERGLNSREPSGRDLAPSGSYPPGASGTSGRGPFEPGTIDNLAYSNDRLPTRDMPSDMHTRSDVPPRGLPLDPLTGLPWNSRGGHAMSGNAHLGRPPGRDPLRPSVNTATGKIDPRNSSHRRSLSPSRRHGRPSVNSSNPRGTNYDDSSSRLRPRMPGERNPLNEQAMRNNNSFGRGPPGAQMSNRAPFDRDPRVTNMPDRAFNERDPRGMDMSGRAPLGGEHRGRPDRGGPSSSRDLPPFSTSSSRLPQSGRMPPDRFGSSTQRDMPSNRGRPGMSEPLGRDSRPRNHLPGGQMDNYAGAGMPASGSGRPGNMSPGARTEDIRGMDMSPRIDDRPGNASSGGLRNDRSRMEDPRRMGADGSGYMSPEESMHNRSGNMSPSLNDRPTMREPPRMRDDDERMPPAGGRPGTGGSPGYMSPGSSRMESSPARGGTPGVGRSAGGMPPRSPEMRSPVGRDPPRNISPGSPRMSPSPGMYSPRGRSPSPGRGGPARDMSPGSPGYSSPVNSRPLSPARRSPPPRNLSPGSPRMSSPVGRGPPRGPPRGSRRSPPPRGGGAPPRGGPPGRRQSMGNRSPGSPPMSRSPSRRGSGPGDMSPGGPGSPGSMGSPGSGGSPRSPGGSIEGSIAPGSPVDGSPQDGSPIDSSAESPMDGSESPDEFGSPTGSESGSEFDSEVGSQMSGSPIEPRSPGSSSMRDSPGGMPMSPSTGEAQNQSPMRDSFQSSVRNSSDLSSPRGSPRSASRGSRPSMNGTGEGVRRRSRQASSGGSFNGSRRSSRAAENNEPEVADGCCCGSLEGFNAWIKKVIQYLKDDWNEQWIEMEDQKPRKKRRRKPDPPPEEEGEGSPASNDNSPISPSQTQDPFKDNGEGDDDDATTAVDNDEQRSDSGSDYDPNQQPHNGLPEPVGETDHSIDSQRSLTPGDTYNSNNTQPYAGQGASPFSNEHTYTPESHNNGYMPPHHAEGQPEPQELESAYPNLLSANVAQRSVQPSLPEMAVELATDNNPPPSPPPYAHVPSTPHQLSRPRSTRFELACEREPVELFVPSSDSGTMNRGRSELFLPPSLTPGVTTHSNSSSPFSATLSTRTPPSANIPPVPQPTWSPPPRQFTPYQSSGQPIVPVQGQQSNYGPPQPQPQPGMTYGHPQLPQAPAPTYPGAPRYDPSGNKYQGQPTQISSQQQPRPLQTSTPPPLVPARSDKRPPSYPPPLKSARGDDRQEPIQPGMGVSNPRPNPGRKDQTRGASKSQKSPQATVGSGSDSDSDSDSDQASENEWNSGSDSEDDIDDGNSEGGSGDDSDDDSDLDSGFGTYEDDLLQRADEIQTDQNQSVSNTQGANPQTQNEWMPVAPQSQVRHDTGHPPPPRSMEPPIKHQNEPERAMDHAAMGSASNKPSSQQVNELPMGHPRKDPGASHGRPEQTMAHGPTKQKNMQPSNENQENPFGDPGSINQSDLPPSQNNLERPEHRSDKRPSDMPQSSRSKKPESSRDRPRNRPSDMPSSSRGKPKQPVNDPRVNPADMPPVEPERSEPQMDHRNKKAAEKPGKSKKRPEPAVEPVDARPSDTRSQPREKSHPPVDRSRANPKDAGIKNKKRPKINPADMPPPSHADVSPIDSPIDENSPVTPHQKAVPGPSGYGSDSEDDIDEDEAASGSGSEPESEIESDAESFMSEDPDEAVDKKGKSKSGSGEGKRREKGRDGKERSGKGRRSRGHGSSSDAKVVGKLKTTWNFLKKLDYHEETR